MSASGTAPPDAREQIAGLSFALLLLAPDLTIAEANPAAEDLLGVAMQRMLGRPLPDLVVFHQPGLLERMQAADARLFVRGLDAKVGGRAMRLNLTISALDTHPGWRAATLSDAAQGDRFEEEERRTPLRGPAVLAHEIKNPLSAIRGAAQLLARKLAESERPLTALITDEVDRIAQLIDRMQRLGREERAPVSPVNPHEAIHKAYATVRLGSPEVIAWREAFDPSLPFVLANEGALVQVLVNLMANARDACATSDAPEIVVQTRFVSGLAMNVTRLGTAVRLPIEIQVSDNGPGIDPAVRDHIFEPFVSSKSNGQGLGLALVQKLVRDMNGRVSHERDEAGGWTHFRLHLPMAL